MNPDIAERAAAALIDARLNRRWLTALPADCAPTTSEDAYSIQEKVGARFGPIGGFKAGNSRASPVFASVMHTSPARVPAGTLRMFGVEMEFGFSFGRDLPPRAGGYRESEIIDAIHAVHPAIEIVESRFADLDKVDELSKLADNGSNGGIVVGPANANWRDFDLPRASVRMLIDGKEVSSAVGGDRARLSVSSLLWLATSYAHRYGGIRRGQVAITGSLTGILIAAPGATVVVDCGDLGQAEVVFEVTK